MRIYGIQGRGGGSNRSRRFRPDGEVPNQGMRTPDMDMGRREVEASSRTDQTLDLYKPTPLPARRLRSPSPPRLVPTVISY